MGGASAFLRTARFLRCPRVSLSSPACNFFAGITKPFFTGRTQRDGGAFMKGYLPSDAFRKKKKKNEKKGASFWLKAQPGLGSASGAGGLPPAAGAAGAGAAKVAASAGQGGLFASLGGLVSRLGGLFAGNTLFSIVAVLLAAGLGIYMTGGSTPAPEISKSLGSAGLNDRAQAVSNAPYAKRAASLDVFKKGYKAAAKSSDGAASYDKDGYTRDGYDKDGYDRKGYDREGNDRDGYARDGYGKDGFGRDGYDMAGFGRDGYHRDGSTRTNYTKDGGGRDGAQGSGGDTKGGLHGGDAASLRGSGAGAANRSADMGGPGGKLSRVASGARVGSGFANLPKFGQRKNTLAMRGGSRTTVSYGKGGGTGPQGQGAFRQASGVQTAQNSYSGAGVDANRSTQNTAWGEGSAAGEVAGGGSGSGSSGGGSSGGGGSVGGGMSVNTSPSLDNIGGSGGNSTLGNTIPYTPYRPKVAKPEDVSPWKTWLDTAKKAMLAAVAFILIASILANAAKAGGPYAIALLNAARVFAYLAMAAAAIVITAGLVLMGQYGQKLAGLIYTVMGGALIVAAYKSLTGINEGLAEAHAKASAEQAALKDAMSYELSSTKYSTQGAVQNFQTGEFGNYGPNGEWIPFK